MHTRHSSLAISCVAIDFVLAVLVPTHVLRLCLPTNAPELVPPLLLVRVGEFVPVVRFPSCRMQKIQVTSCFIFPPAIKKRRRLSIQQSKHLLMLSPHSKPLECRKIDTRACFEIY